MPPVIPNVDGAPGTIDGGVAVADVAAVEFTITMVLTHIVVLHNPCALT